MEELVEKVKNGDKEIYRDLISDMKEELYRIAKKKIKNSNDIEDVIQETIINGYFKIGQLRNNKHFRTWIIKILINECNLFYRNKRHEDDIKNRYKDELETKGFKNDSVGFDNLIQDLNDIEKNIFKLYYEEEQSIEEISNILKINKNTIKTKLRRGRDRANSTYKKIIMTVVILAIITTGITFGKDIINYLKDIFNLSSIGQNNDGILMAIEEKEWIQNIEMDYIELDKGYKIRIDYLLVDDINMYMIYDLKSDEDLNEYDRMSIIDLTIKDENNNIIFNNKDLMEETIVQLEGWKNIETESNTNIRELNYMISNGNFNMKKLEITFSKVMIYSSNNPSKDSKIINENEKKIYIDIDEKFINTNTIEYITEYEDNNEYNIQKAIITETGFYAIIKSKNMDVNFTLEIDEHYKHKCSYRLLSSYNSEEIYYYLILSDINLTDNYKQLLLKNKNEVIRLYKKEI